MPATKKSHLWTKEMPGGERELRTGSKIILTAIPILLAALLFQALITFEKIEGGAKVIEALAYTVVVLVITMSLVALLITLIDYIRSLE